MVNSKVPDTGDLILILSFFEFRRFGEGFDVPGDELAVSVGSTGVSAAERGDLALEESR